MKANTRRLLSVLLALVVGVALAAAVVLMMDGTEEPVATGAVATSTIAAASSEDAADDSVIDPAKMEPLLDKFVSKDPFIPLPTAAATPAPSNSPTPQATALTAKVTVDGKSYTVGTGDKIPSGSPALTVSSISSDSVTFTPIDGDFTNGDPSMTVGVGESVKVTVEGGASYVIKVVSVGNSSGTSQNGHTLKVLSITESNGTALVSLEIDGQTYADKEVGDTFSTGWGDVKIVAINVAAQTVTIMRGDQTITLSAGQSVVK